MARSRKKPDVLQKVPTGISGFDQITGGGIPEGRTSLVCGAAGCGKTLFGLQTLVRGAVDDGEPGAFVAFEETEEDLVKNVASLGFDLRALEKKKLLSIDHIHIERSEIEENGQYDLEGLFIRLQHALDSIGAKRLVIDTLETIFAGLKSDGIIRSELRRLFQWLKDRGITTIVTAERGEGTLTRHGLEEYVSDCVILLDHRVHDQVSTRRLRVVKYRGSSHGSNEYPFLIDHAGITVVPITSSDLEHAVSSERISTGVPGLDDMLGGAGYFRGSTILVSGTAGSGKSSIAAHFAAATCARGERCLFLSYEESAQQRVRNMSSIGLDLGKYMKQGRLQIVAHRPTSLGLEGHLALLYELTAELKPTSLVIDPISVMTDAGGTSDAHLMLVRLVDFLKTRGVTVLLTSLTVGGASVESTDVAISSLVDTWLLVKAIENNGERTRGIYVLKSRGMAHSNQIREFLITDKGISLEEPYIGPAGVLTGTARVAQEARDALARRERLSTKERATRLLAQKKALFDRRVAELQAEFASDEAELLANARVAADIEDELADNEVRMQRMRGTSSKNSGQRRRSAPAR